MGKIKTYLVKINDTKSSDLFVLYVRAVSEKQAQFLAQTRLRSGSANKHFSGHQLTRVEIDRDFKTTIQEAPERYRANNYIGELSFHNTNESGCNNILYLNNYALLHITNEEIINEYGVY